jgi:putative tricarboxylic transport membrane protein
LGALPGIGATTAASSLIPLVTLGIPGSVAAAVMYGAFMIQGMIPGPMLMLEHPEIIYGLFVLLLLTDFIGAFVVALAVIALVWSLWRKTRGKSSALAVPEALKH